MAINSVSAQHHYFKSEDLHKPILIVLEEGEPIEIEIEEASREQTFPEITYSVMPVLEQIESSPPEKYTEPHLLEIRALLAKRAEKIRVVTYNILLDMWDHKLKDPIHSWTARLPKVVQSIHNMRPDVLCLQESYPNQIEDLRRSLGEDYAYFAGAGATGEVNAIFYNKERFEIDLENYGDDLANATLEMPLNPKDEELIPPNKMLPPEIEPGRQLTLTHFKDKLTGKTFAVINAHLAFYRHNSREVQAQFITGLVQKLQDLKIPVVFAGDLNTFSNLPDREFPFFDGTRICQIFQKVMKDTRDVALLGRVGPSSTALRVFIGRDGLGPFVVEDNPEVTLDHIYVSPEVSVIINATEPALVDGRFPSDHMPVIADIILP